MFRLCRGAKEENERSEVKTRKDNDMNRSKLHLLRNMAALPDGKYPLAFTARVDGMATRSTGKDEWAEGDKIGVRIGADGATGCYELNSDGSMKNVITPVYWQNTASSTVTAWYPYSGKKERGHLRPIERLCKH